MEAYHTIKRLLPTGIAALLNVLVLLSVLLGWEGVLWYLIPLTTLLTSTTSHVSAFYNIVLVVTRSVKMLFPFYTLQNRPLKIAFVVYPVIWVVIVGFELHYFINHSSKSINWVLQNLTFMPAVGGRLISFVDGKGLLSYLILCYGVPYAIPAIICVVCFFIQAGVLLRNRSHQKVSSSSERVNFRITITILWLTTVFLICNTIYLLFIILLIVPSLTTWKDDGDFVTICFESYLASVVLPFINSALNPLILMMRGEELKVFVRSKVGGRAMVRMCEPCTMEQSHSLTENVELTTK